VVVELEVDEIGTDTRGEEVRVEPRSDSGDDREVEDEAVDSGRGPEFSETNMTGVGGGGGGEGESEARLVELKMGTV
jgi:hypothetical protein